MDMKSEIETAPNALISSIADLIDSQSSLTGHKNAKIIAFDKFKLHSSAS